jgi:hypothetical protein
MAKMIRADKNAFDAYNDTLYEVVVLKREQARIKRELEVKTALLFERYRKVPSDEAKAWAAKKYDVVLGKKLSIDANKGTSVDGVNLSARKVLKVDYPLSNQQKELILNFLLYREEPVVSRTTVAEFKDAFARMSPTEQKELMVLAKQRGITIEVSDFIKER